MMIQSTLEQRQPGPEHAGHEKSYEHGRRGRWGRRGGVQCSCFHHPHQQRKPSLQHFNHMFTQDPRHKAQDTRHKTQAPKAKTKNRAYKSRGKGRGRGGACSSPFGFFWVLCVLLASGVLLVFLASGALLVFRVTREEHSYSPL